MIKKAVILAGGKGTRLAQVVSDLPKPMADIYGMPFLHYLILDLKKKGIQEIVLLVGHLHETIQAFFGDTYHDIGIRYEVESEPRGTGGMIYELSKKWNEPILLVNGDTYFDVDIQKMYELFLETNAMIMAVKEIKKSDRYGTLTIENNRIIDFKEKTWIDSGYINGGIYIIPPTLFSRLEMPFSFSLEKDFLERFKSEILIHAYKSIGFFIDIGIPEDYQKAQILIPRQFLPKIDSSWTLFLDRDGVLNKHLPEDYVKKESEFEWIEGSKEAVVSLSSLFGRILIVTNQQGIGKKLMTELDLERIHWKMQSDVEEAGGRIDRVYYCPHRKEINCKCRKPKNGMALKAKEDFPTIDFMKSIIIGDSLTDLEFGISLGMFPIFISKEKYTKKETLRFESLHKFLSLTENQFSL